MLRLLLDEHISPQVAVQASRRCKGIEIVAISKWYGGVFLGTPDPEILIEAAKEGRTLVTYDQRTMGLHLAALTQHGVDHGGVVFVSERTIPTRDIGSLVRALHWLWETQRDQLWTNRAVFLASPPDRD